MQQNPFFRQQLQTYVSRKDALLQHGPGVKAAIDALQAGPSSEQLAHIATHFAAWVTSLGVKALAEMPAMLT
eukprot:5018087-Alexandrium_andersonii.AAC.1